MNLYSSEFKELSYEDKRKAVIIGVGNYLDPSIPTLRAPENDAKEIYEPLSDPTFGKFEITNNHFLVDRLATSDRIRRAIGDIFSKPDSISLTIFYYAGHGIMDRNNDMYLCPYDISVEDPLVSGINIRDLNDVISQSENKKNIVTILDCSYSGRAIEGIRLKSISESRFVIASTGAGAVSREYDMPHTAIQGTHPHGQMSYHLIEGLYGKASDEKGIVTLDSLFTYIEQGMRKDGLARPRFAKVDPGDGAEDIKFGYTSRKPVDLKNYYKNSIAIIIGISKYKEENKLPNAYNDAIAIKRVLKGKYGFDMVFTLFDKEATYANIRAMLIENLRDSESIGPDDRVLIYYAGHGKLQTKIIRDGTELKLGYIVPYDAQKDKYSTYIEMETVVDSCRDSPAKHVLIVLDCCYSGYAAMRGDETEKPMIEGNQYIKQITANTAIQVLAAGQEDQPVNDSGIRRGNSAFTGALLDILETERDLDNDGILTAREIGSKLGYEVARQTIGIPQRPVFNNLHGSGLGDFVFKIFDTK